MDGDAYRRRRRPAHGVFAFPDNPTVIFDTVCTKNRSKWLATDDVHDLLRSVWKAATAWRVGRYVIMPDHVHYFAVATHSSISFDAWVQYWKSQFTKQHRVPDHRWLPDHWDTRMRTADEFERTWKYVFHNPVRHGLVEHPENWPYQGEVFRWRWE